MTTRSDIIDAMIDDLAETSVALTEPDGSTATVVGVWEEMDPTVGEGQNGTVERARAQFRAKGSALPSSPPVRYTQATVDSVTWQMEGYTRLSGGTAYILHLSRALDIEASNGSYRTR